MQTIGLDNTLREIYNDHIAFIRGKNIELEREYFTEKAAFIPMADIMIGTSFEDHFWTLKQAVNKSSKSELDRMFMLLEEYFLFSQGHDLMFKKKLEADIFNSVPMEEFLYPRLEKAVKEKFNDVSVMPENEKAEENKNAIGRMVYTFTELQSLLYFLYCNDFQFATDWEKLWEDTHEDIIRILNESGLTIGEFLYALVDYKCQIMADIFGKLEDENLKKEFLERIEELRKQKHEETKTFTHVDLPVTYFLDHSMVDFLKRKPKSKVLDEGNPDASKKIVLPN